MGLLTGCGSAESAPDALATPTPSVTDPSPTPTVEAKPAAELPDVPIIATITARANDEATDAILDLTLVAHLPQDLGTPAADQIIEVLTEAGDTSLLSVPAWRADNQVKLMILDLTTTQVGGIAWPADSLIGIEIGPWVVKEARAPLGVEWSTIDGRFGYGTYVSGVIDGHVVAAYTYEPGRDPLAPWYDYQSSLGFIGYRSTNSYTAITDCVYSPTPLAEPWEANPSWYLYQDEDFGGNYQCGAGFSGE